MKCWSLAFSPFPQMFSQGLFPRLSKPRIVWQRNGPMSVMHLLICVNCKHLFGLVNDVLPNFQQYFSHITATAHIIHLSWISPVLGWGPNKYLARHIFVNYFYCGLELFLTLSQTSSGF